MWQLRSRYGIDPTKRGPDLERHVSLFLIALWALVIPCTASGVWAQPSAVVSLKNIRALAISSEDQVLVTIDASGSVERRTLPDGSVVGARLKIGHVGPVTFSPGADFASLAANTYADRSAASIWNLSDGSLLREFRGFESLALAPDYGLAAAWKRMSYDLTLVDVASGSIVSILAGESRQEFEQAAISPDGRWVATGHHQGLVKQWDVRSGLPIRELGDLNHQRVSVITFSPDGKRVVAGATNVFRDRPLLSMWEAATGYFDKGFVSRVSMSGPTSVAFSSNGHWLISGHYQGEVVLWDSFSGDGACALSDFGVSNVGPITHVGFSSDSAYAFARRSDGTAKVWQVNGCLARYLHRTEVANELRKSKLFAPKGEFETSEQYAARLAKAKTLEAEIVERLGSKLGDDLRRAANAVRQKVVSSTTTVTLKIQSIGQYNADRQVFPVTIDGVTEIVAVPLGEAAQFKTRYASAKVAGQRRLQDDLTRSELYDVVITNPATGSRYAFGRHETASPEYSPRSPLTLREMADRQRSAAQQAVRTSLQSFETADCTEGETSIPFNVDAVFLVDPKRECWTPWVTVGGRSFRSSQTGNILIQFMYKDGTISDPIEDGPKKSLSVNRPVAKTRFKSLRKEPVTVTLTVY